jgi:hypothetical protein
MAAMTTLTRGRVRAALALAMLADVVQVGLFPLFGWGVLFWPNGVLDALVGIVMCVLLGWHWAFLPSFVAEMTPWLDLFPTWTTAVLFVTRGTPAWGRDELPVAGAMRPGALGAGSGQALGPGASRAALKRSEP